MFVQRTFLSTYFQEIACFEARAWLHKALLKYVSTVSKQLTGHLS